MRSKPKRKESGHDTWVSKVSKIARWPSGVAIGLFGFYLTYVYAGADQLRSEVYQPLYSEVILLEQPLRVNSIDKPLHEDTLNSLQQSGRFGRIPKSLRDEIQQFYKRASDLHGLTFFLMPEISRQVSLHVRDLRTEELDRAWVEDMVKHLRVLSEAHDGTIKFQFYNLCHAMVSPVTDIRDPRNVFIVLPGGPTWQIADWLGFPKSAADLEPCWTDSQFLIFDEMHTFWYNRITREDLARKGITLTQFLSPIHGAITADPNFQSYVRMRPDTLSRLETVKTKLVERIRQPKKLADLFDN